MSSPAITLAVQNAMTVLNIELTGKDVDVLESALADEGYELREIR